MKSHCRIDVFFHNKRVPTLDLCNGLFPEWHVICNCGPSKYRSRGGRKNFQSCTHIIKSFVYFFTSFRLSTLNLWKPYLSDLSYRGIDHQLLLTESILSPVTAVTFLLILTTTAPRPILSTRLCTTPSHLTPSGQNTAPSPVLNRQILSNQTSAPSAAATATRRERCFHHKGEENR